MNLLMLVVLLGGAWFMLEAGYAFIAFLLFLISVLFSLSGSNAKNAAPASAPPAQRPVIVTTTGGEMPKQIKVAVKGAWGGTDEMEDFMTTIGQILNLFGATAARIIGLKTRMPDDWPKK